MTKLKSIVVFGATGGTGRQVVTQALQAVYSEGIRAVGTAMAHAGVRRLLCLSAGAVEVRALASWPVRLLTRYVLQQLFRHLYADMRRMEALLQPSPLDWTIVRPPRLVDGPRTGWYRVALNQPLPHPGKLARADLADYLLQHLTDAATYRATVELSC